MKVSIKIEQIDNGFILNLFDYDGPAKNDKEIFVINWAIVLKTLKEWRREAKERGVKK